MIAKAIVLLVSLVVAHARPPQVEVRVRLQRELSSLSISGFGLRVSPPNGLLGVDGAVGLGGAKISRAEDGTWLLKWVNAKKALRLHGERLLVHGQMLRLGAQPVPYDFEVIENPKRGLDVVTRLDLDQYLMGVLPAEMPASWPMEALKAQAVAARSFVLRQAFDRQDGYFDVDSTVMDQVYKFLDQAQAHPDWVRRVARAIVETRGEVLFDPKRKVLKAFYSADCGCQSEDPQFVWGKLDAFESVRDPSCGQYKPLAWKLNLARREVRVKLMAALKLPEDTNLKALQVGSRTPSGRVAEVLASVEVDGRTKKVAIHSQEFRRIFGFQKIQSADFSLGWLGDELQIRGSGSGHGVGLCQRGARSLAEDGMGYREILKMYYPRANLQSRTRT